MKIMYLQYTFIPSQSLYSLAVFKAAVSIFTIEQAHNEIVQLIHPQKKSCFNFRVVSHIQWNVYI